MNRPRYPADAYAQRDDPSTDAGRIFARLRHLLEVRRRTPELAGNALITFDTHNPHLVAYQRPGPGDAASWWSPTWPTTRSTWTPRRSRACPRRREDLLAGDVVDLRGGLTVPAHGVVWLRVEQHDEGGPHG